MLLAAVFVEAALVSFVLCLVFVPMLRRSGIVGKDHNKLQPRVVPQMGGLAVILGFCAGMLIALAFNQFLRLEVEFDVVGLLAATATILMIGFIGLIDDLLGMPQLVKAITPAIAALPLVVVRSGVTVMSIPFVGPVDFGLVYVLVFVPFGVTGAANAINILGGFDGLEAGMGLVAMSCLAVIAAHTASWTAFVLLLAGVGAILGFLIFNWYPARIFLGDIGALTIGGVIAAAAIVGDFEVAGLLVIIPHALDLAFKAVHRFPSAGWQGEVREDGKLYCPEHGPIGLCQFVLKLFGGLRERTLVLVLMGLEALFGIGAILLYLL